jgi:hypothetical protein
MNSYFTDVGDNLDNQIVEIVAKLQPVTQESVITELEKNKIKYGQGNIAIHRLIDDDRLKK